MTTYKQGDIILVWFPDSNLMTAKKRPAVVLQSNNWDQSQFGAQKIDRKYPVTLG